MKSAARASLLAIGSLSLIAVITVVFHVYDFGATAPLYTQLRDTLHAPGFALLTFATMGLLLLAIGKRQYYIKSLIFLIFMATLSEASQLLGPREASLKDFIADFAGIGSAALIVAGCARLARGGWMLGIALLLPGLAGTAMIFAEPVRLSSAILSQAQAFPALLTFDEAFEHYLFRVSSGNVQRVPAPPAWPAASGSIGRVRMNGPQQPGLEFAPYPDWRGYDQLTFTAASGHSTPLQITIRVNDFAHDGRYDDRFNFRLLLPLEPTRFSLSLEDIFASPVGRRMDAARIRRIVWFTSTGGDEPQYMLIDDVTLERAETR